MEESQLGCRVIVSHCFLCNEESGQTGDADYSRRYLSEKINESYTIRERLQEIFGVTVNDGDCCHSYLCRQCFKSLVSACNRHDRKLKEEAKSEQEQTSHDHGTGNPGNTFIQESKMASNTMGMPVDLTDDTCKQAEILDHDYCIQNLGIITPSETVTALSTHGEDSHFNKCQPCAPHSNTDGTSESVCACIMCQKEGKLEATDQMDEDTFPFPEEASTVDPSEIAKWGPANIPENMPFTNELCFLCNRKFVKKIRGFKRRSLKGTMHFDRIQNDKRDTTIEKALMRFFGITVDDAAYEKCYLCYPCYHKLFLMCKHGKPVKPPKKHQPVNMVNGSQKTDGHSTLSAKKKAWKQTKALKISQVKIV